MKNLKIILISSLFASIIILAVLSALFNMLSLKDLAVLKISGNKFGVTLTTITEDTLVSDLGTILPTNFNALNDGKIENTTTTLPLITTLGALSTVGTITSGSWSATDIAVSAGGTGWSYFTSNALLLGNGSGALATTTAGSNGQVLTLVGGAPVWQSGTFDTTVNYDLTGGWIFHASSTFYKLELMENGAATSTIDKTRWDTLTSGATSNASTLHYHSGMCATGWGIKEKNITGTEAITHGLGVTPTYIQIEARRNIPTTFIETSFGVATSTGTAQGATGSSFQYGGDPYLGHGTSSIIYIIQNGSTAHTIAAISAISATTFTLNWTTNINAYSGTHYIWTACR